MLSGVYKLHNLEDAQNRGLALFWAHDLKALTEWIATTRTDPRPACLLHGPIVEH